MVFLWLLVWNRKQIFSGKDLRKLTSAKGLFVAGDVRTKELRQVITAAADGANAAAQVIKYLK